MREVIDKNKVEIWYNHLRQTNPHYQDILLETDLIDEFCESIRKMADNMTAKAPIISTPEDEIEKEVIEEVPLSRQNDTLMSNKYEQSIDDNTVPNRYADMIIKFEIENKIPPEEDPDDLPDISSDESDDESEEDPNDRSDKIAKQRTENISVAPAEKGSFKNFGEEAVVYTGDLKREESILEWLMVQKDPSNDAIEELEGENLRNIVESSDAVAVFVCKYSNIFLLVQILTTPYFQIHTRNVTTAWKP